MNDTIKTYLLNYERILVATINSLSIDNKAKKKNKLILDQLQSEHSNLIKFLVDNELMKFD